jgi:hypothetical protein
MLTDDDLTRELGEAFRSATTDLTYNGRTAPRRPAAIVVPVVAVGGVLAAGVGIAAGSGGGSHSSARPSVAISTSAQPQPAGHRASAETMTLAAFTARYVQAAEGKFPIVAEVVKDGLPSGVRELATPGTAARAWIGKDPRSGDNALYVKAPTREGGRLFALLSPSWTKHQLIYLFRHGN